MSEAALGLMFDLAQRGEIDPWDVDVVQLTDRFLASLGEWRTQDLEHMGQGMFYASVLIHLKAQHLEQQMFPVAPPEVLEEDQATVWRSPLPLEQAIRRRLAAPQALPIRPLTLEDLVAHLRAVEGLAPKLPAPTPLRRRSEVRSLQQVKELAHQENLEALILHIRSQLQILFAQQASVTMEDLARITNDPLGSFLALLFLAARSHVIITQEEFYGDLWIQPGSRWIS